MPTLGDLLAAARRDAAGFEDWIGGTDPDFASALAQAARSHALAPAAFVRMAVGDFSRFASEEDWASLVSGIRDAPDPGMTCLCLMVRWRLSVAGYEQPEPEFLQGGAS